MGLDHVLHCVWDFTIFNHFRGRSCLKHGILGADGRMHTARGRKREAQVTEGAITSSIFSKTSLAARPAPCKRMLSHYRCYPRGECGGTSYPAGLSKGTMCNGWDSDRSLWQCFTVMSVPTFSTATEFWEQNSI